MINSAQLSIVDRYGLHGDSAPPIAKIEKWISVLSRSDRPTTMLITADLWTELAMQSDESATEMLENAEQTLTDVVNNHVYLTSRGFGEFAANYGHATLALMKLSNLPVVRHCLTGDEVDGLDTDLSGMEGLFRYRIPAVDQVQSTVAEYVPIILSNRAQRRGAVEKLTGRLALYREDKRLLQGRPTNPNWDVALFGTEKTNEVHAPLTRLQVKKANGSSTRASLSSGVIPIVVKRLGIKNPLALIASCLQETGIQLDASFEAETYSPDQMDGFYENMLSKIGEARLEIEQEKA